MYTGFLGLNPNPYVHKLKQQSCSFLLRSELACAANVAWSPTRHTGLPEPEHERGVEQGAFYYMGPQALQTVNRVSAFRGLATRCGVQRRPSAGV